MATTTENRVPNVHRKKLAMIMAVLIIDMVAAILIMEVLLRVVGYDFGDPSNRKIPIAFMKGEQGIFQDHGGTFTYVPHIQARTELVYYWASDFKVEFDYAFSTNNFGLVQSNDIVPGKKSVLVLGDSFTEGEGGPPWFPALASVIEQHGYQPINGGLRGTGFRMWWELAQYLQSAGIQIDKLVIVFTSWDYTARPVTFTDEYLRCLSGPVMQNCDVRKNYYLPLPPQEQVPMWVDAVRKARSHPPARPRGRVMRIKEKLKLLLPATYQVYRFLGEKISPPPADPEIADLEIQSRNAIRALIDRYGAENVIFVHIPLKDETRPDTEGAAARLAISASGGVLFDGFEHCGLSVSDYYPVDVHPNEAGYKKVFGCVAQAYRGIAAN